MRVCKRLVFFQREIDERRKQQQSVKASIRDKRQQHARIRKYYDDFHVRMRSKMLKKRTREEMVIILHASVLLYLVLHTFTSSHFTIRLL